MDYTTYKPDRALVNDGWKCNFPYAIASFLNHSISKHSSCVVNYGIEKKRRKVLFILFNMWAYHERFLDIVKDSWKEKMEYSPMFILVTKLKD